jgi:predicted mannosyl-3-phosphoglycerate phosphatase (HAD superfamily)
MSRCAFLVRAELNEEKAENLHHRIDCDIRGSMQIRRIGALFIGFFLTAWIVACAHRPSGEYSVDEVQGCVNKVEDHLRELRKALKERNLDKAKDAYKQAQEMMEENKAALANYPEIGELTALVTRSESALCYAAVSISLERYFEAIRAKDGDKARPELGRAQKEFGQCQEKIKERDDFVPLKMNLETAPQALADLEKELARPKLLEKMREVQKEIGRKIKSIEEKLVSMEKQPKQKELNDLEEEVKWITGTLEEKADFKEEKEWSAYVSSLQSKLREIDGKRLSLQKGSKIQWVVEEPLSTAAKLTTKAATTRNPAEVLKLMEGVVQSYSECEKALAAVLKEDPALSAQKVSYLGASRRVDWLLRHCVSEKQRTKKLVERLSGKVAGGEGKKPEAAEKQEQKKEPTAQKPPPKTQPPQKQKRQNTRW